MNIREGFIDTMLRNVAFVSEAHKIDARRNAGKEANVLLAHLKSQIEQMPCFYTEAIFPTTIEEAGKLFRDKGLTDLEITAISGCIARLGWNNYLKTITEMLE